MWISTFRFVLGFVGLWPRRTRLERLRDKLAFAQSREEFWVGRNPRRRAHWRRRARELEIMMREAERDCASSR